MLMEKIGAVLVKWLFLVPSTDSMKSIRAKRAPQACIGEEFEVDNRQIDDRLAVMQ